MTNLTPADEQRINEIIDARLKESRHENSDHLDRGLLLRKLAASGAASGSVPVWNATTQFWTAMTAGAQVYHSFTNTVSDTTNLTITCGFQPRLILALGGRNNSTSVGGISVGMWSATGDRDHGCYHWSWSTSALSGGRDTGTDYLFMLDSASAGTAIKRFAVSSVTSTTAVIARSTNNSTDYGLSLLLIG